MTGVLRVLLLLAASGGFPPVLWESFRKEDLPPEAFLEEGPGLWERLGYSETVRNNLARLALAGWPEREEERARRAGVRLVPFDSRDYPRDSPERPPPPCFCTSGKMARCGAVRSRGGNTKMQFLWMADCGGNRPGGGRGRRSGDQRRSRRHRRRRPRRVPRRRRRHHRCARYGSGHGLSPGARRALRPHSPGWRSPGRRVSPRFSSQAVAFPREEQDHRRNGRSPGGGGAPLKSGAMSTARPCPGGRQGSLGRSGQDFRGRVCRFEPAALDGPSPLSPWRSSSPWLSEDSSACFLPERNVKKLLH